ncbi:hypothetical protein O6H91_Y468400 [Diphasiastrum complanatum]|nr:hypothetical protein O6H91_Y468400 [Diphasiastrum complanatum]
MLLDVGVCLEPGGGAMSSSRAVISASPVDRGVFAYTACYCEENVYHLCKSLVHLNLAAPDASDLFVAFISNSVKQVPIWRQRSSAQENGLCMWDYHVVCIQKSLETDAGAFVWDLDTTLPFPVSFIQYIEEALQSSMVMNPRYQRLNCEFQDNLCIP